MRRIVFALLAISGAFAACSTFSGGDEASAGDAGAESGADAPAQADASALDVTDGGSADSGCDVDTPPGVFYTGSLDNGTCDGWAVAFGTIAPVASPTRCGAGACKVCANSAMNQPMLSREVPVTGDGATFQFDVQLYGDTLVGMWSATLDLSNDAGPYANASNAGAFVTGAWSPAQVIFTNAGPTTKVGVRLYASSTIGNECFYVDQLTFAHY